ncbi:MAG: YggS family pyridoxal phosphate-dependent enzyme [Crocinitomicaceae bacterium]
MISENLVEVLKEIPNNVTLVAVSKTKPIEAIEEAYLSGQRHFGENKVQELVAKYEKLPKDINWHLIGHLQTNKVKYVAPFVHLIHAVDSEKLLIEIDKQAYKNNRIIDVLLQFHIAQEDTKFGLSMGECKLLLKNSRSFLNTRIIGVMGMASFVDDENQIRNEFKTLRNIFNELKSEYFGDVPYFSTISMGMSGDYSLAIEEGSTMVRVGSAIFGTR